MLSLTLHNTHIVTPINILSLCMSQRNIFQSQLHQVSKNLITGL